MKLYLAINLNKEETSFLQQKIENLELICAENIPERQRIDYFKDADICFGNVPPNWLNNTNKLKWLQLESVGFGEYQQVKVLHELVITNLKGFFDVPVAETVLAGILSFYRGIDHFGELKKQNEWLGASIRPSLKTLKNEQILILGGGSIGKQLKKLLAAFEAKVSIFDKYLSAAEINNLFQLEKRLSDFNVVISCLPETQETIELLNENRLKALNENTLFINVGRGSVVNESFLIELLKKRKIRGAILDVTTKEPLPKDHALWTCPNTILTQHTGGGYDREIMGKVELFLENLGLFKSGKKLKNIVDLKKGY